MKPYFYVFRVGGDTPAIKHATLALAQKESERLASKHPGQIFEILQCLGISRVQTAQTFWMDGVVPPHVCAMNGLLDHTCGICGSMM